MELRKQKLACDIRDLLISRLELASASSKTTGFSNIRQLSASLGIALSASLETISTDYTDAQTAIESSCERFIHLIQRQSQTMDDSVAHLACESLLAVVERVLDSLLEMPTVFSTPVDLTMALFEVATATATGLERFEVVVAKALDLMAAQPPAEISRCMRLILASEGTARQEAFALQMAAKLVKHLDASTVSLVLSICQR